MVLEDDNYPELPPRVSLLFATLSTFYIDEFQKCAHHANVPSNLLRAKKNARCNEARALAAVDNGEGNTIFIPIIITSCRGFLA